MVRGRLQYDYQEEEKI